MSYGNSGSIITAERRSRLPELGPQYRHHGAAALCQVIIEDMSPVGDLLDERTIPRLEATFASRASELAIDRGWARIPRLVVEVRAGSRAGGYEVAFAYCDEAKARWFNDPLSLEDYVHGAAGR